LEESASSFIFRNLGSNPTEPQAILDCLLSWARANGAILRETWKQKFRRETKGKEHEIWSDGNGKIFKATFGRRYGLGFTGTGDGNALDYLIRIRLCNALFDTDWHLEGVWLDHNEARIVTSQKFVRGDNTPVEKISAFMASRQFEDRVIDDKLLYYRAGDNLVVADLHEKNVLTTPNGKLVPIDVIIGKPSPELENALKAP
jgi:hypothetical protein